MAENCVNKKRRVLSVVTVASRLLSMQSIFFLFKYVSYNFPLQSKRMYTSVPPFSFYRFSFSLLFAVAAFCCSSTSDSPRFSLTGGSNNSDINNNIPSYRENTIISYSFRACLRLRSASENVCEF